MHLRFLIVKEPLCLEKGVASSPNGCPLCIFRLDAINYEIGDLWITPVKATRCVGMGGWIST